MNKVHFKAGAPLTHQSPIYLQREADHKADIYLSQMEYISIIEPRQQGKSSLINQLIGRFSSQGYIFATRDLMAARTYSHSMSDWYTSLGKWLLRQLSFIPADRQPNLPKDSASWEEFLAEVANCAVLMNQHIVIVLDEIGAMPKEWATDFFSVLRSIYTSRQSIFQWRYLTFIISGAFNPKELIQDRTVSDFNVDHRIILHDFTLDQLKQLVSHLNLSNDIVENLSLRIYYWTDGQPYLSQWICSIIEEQIILNNTDINSLVDSAVRHFFNSDTHYLDRIKTLCATRELLNYTHHITNERPTMLRTGLNDKHFYLANVLGVIKANQKGLCQIRNRICDQALEEIQENIEYNKSLGYKHSPGKSGSSRTLGPIKKLQIFVMYVQEDEILLNKLKKHLSTLAQQELITIWYDQNINAGQNREDEISKHLKEAHVVLFLVSSDFVDSDYCFGIEVQQSLKRHLKKETCVIPIILRPVDWSHTKFGHLQALPTHGKAITTWPNEDEAFVDIVIGIQKVLEELTGLKKV